jgi:hypothetical protein
MDEIHITQRLRTALVGTRPSSRTEVELGTPEAGTIAVFRPTDAEIQRGEADLAVERESDAAQTPRFPRWSSDG